MNTPSPATQNASTLLIIADGDVDIDHWRHTHYTRIVLTHVRAGGSIDPRIGDGFDRIILTAPVVLRTLADAIGRLSLDGALELPPRAELDLDSVRRSTAGQGWFVSAAVGSVGDSGLEIRRRPAPPGERKAVARWQFWRRRSN